MATQKSALIKSLEEVMRAPKHAEGMTVVEMAKAVGRDVAWCRERLRILLDEGRLDVSRVARPALDGGMRPVPAYRLKKT